ncbi:MAG: ATP phosphoribosyltransferase [Bacteroidetes bacterium]|nr:ATP phosphoribosyltransferase [Bacteroidota bacterium]MBK8660206.1 ATP phosphoribosyltransferase [Bacteroidota bacterium]
METKLKIAIQKSGRLNEDSLRLIKDCGIAVDNGTDQLKVTARNFPAEIFFLRNSDIPQYVEDGVADIALIGQNILVEKAHRVEVKLALGFSKCRVCLAIPKRDEYPGLRYFEGKKIATSYPNTVRAFLQQHHLAAEIHEISGSVEIAPNIGLADAICDIVSTGSTLFKNGLKEVEVLFESEAVLIAGQNLRPGAQQLLDKLLFRIQAVQAARSNKYILLNAPNDKLNAIIALLPGMKSPTILPLAKEGWSSLHSVISEKEFWDKIDALKQHGAEGILVVPIEKMVM